MQNWIQDHFGWMFAFAVIWNVCWFGYFYWRRFARGPLFPGRDTVSIQFEEWWTSGASFKSFLTRLGGASNCLRVTVTDDELWVTPHFPFNALADQIDLEHRILKSSIRRLERRGRKAVRITFALADGDERTIELYLRRTDEFVAAIEHQTDSLPKVSVE